MGQSEAVLKRHDDFDVLAECAPEQVEGVGHDVVQVERHGRDDLLASEEK
jgi:hypothetical protein